MRELAPYGHYLQKKLLQGSKYEIAIIFIGKAAKERAQSFQEYLPYTLYLPPSHFPTRYNWPLKGCEVYLIDTGSSSLNFIKFCMSTFCSYGALSIRYISKAIRYSFKEQDNV